MQEVPSERNTVEITQISKQRDVLLKDVKEFYVDAISLDIRLSEGSVIGDLAFVGFRNINKANKEELDIHADLSGHTYHVSHITDASGKIKTSLRNKIPEDVNNIYFGDGAFIEEAYRGKGYGKDAMRAFIDDYMKEGDVAVIWPFPIATIQDMMSEEDFKKTLKKVQKSWISVGYKALNPDQQESLYYLVK